MLISGDAHQKIESYLATIHAALRGLSREQSREIVAELRSHILEKASSTGGTASANVDDTLTALGKPEELAREYVTDHLLGRAEASRSPVRVLASLFRWASVSVVGFFVLLLSVAGYFLGACFTLVAVLKPIHPDTAGLWMARDAAGDLAFSLRMGFGSPPVGMREVLGWWIVPVGLIAGCGLAVATTTFALSWARMYRRSRALPHRTRKDE